MKLYLLGTNHANQMIGCKYGKAEEFLKYLHHIKSKIKDIDLVAEELNEEALELWNATDSACRIFANSFNLPHLYCDPNLKERNTLGIKSETEIRDKLGYGKCLNVEQDNEVQSRIASYFDLREDFWLKRILHSNRNQCLFIFGTSHFDSFSKLLQSKNIESIEITRNWGQ